MDMNRRDFVTGAVALAGGLCAGLSGCANQGAGETGTLNPDVAEAAQKGTVVVGTTADYPTDGAYGKFVDSDRLLVVRNGKFIYAVSAICPHRASLCRAVAGGIACPKHGSRFSLTGEVTKGPADDNLPRYAITLKDGKITVDKGRKVTAKDADAAISA